MKKIAYALLASFARMGPLKVRQPDDNVLVIARSKINGVLRTAYGLGIMGLWYYLLLRTTRREPQLLNSLTSPYFWLWLIGFTARICFAGKIAKLAVAAVNEDSFDFDRSTGLIVGNGEVLRQFTDIEAVQLE